MVNSSRADSTTARSMRTGSSRKRTSGSPIQRIRRASRSCQPADVVDDREGADVVEERVDREVAAERVLFGRAVGVVALDQAVVRARFAAIVAASPRPRRSARSARVDVRRSSAAASSASAISASGLGGIDLAPERRDLDGLGAELDVREAEAPADDPAVAKELLDLVRMRRGPDVEVLRAGGSAAGRGRCRRPDRRRSGARAAGIGL